MICDLWQRDTDSIHNMRILNTDAFYHQIFLLIGSLFCSMWIIGKGTLRIGLELSHSATYMDEGVAVHVI